MFNEQQGLFKKDGRHRYSVFNALLNSVFKKVYVYVSWVIFFFLTVKGWRRRKCVFP